MFYLSFIIYMGKRKFRLAAIFVILFNAFGWSFTYVEARSWSNEQPATCNWPSQMMTYYFEFQKWAKSILLWSEINEKRFKESLSPWLFTRNYLDLHWSTAIDILASNVAWSMKSFFSNVITSMVLLLLASESAIQSNTEWLAILFKDRPIVRDYKEMLDIETDLFDVAYFRSKQIDLTRPFDSDLAKSLGDLIKEYQSVWLLEPGENMNWNETMSAIMLDLIYMNTSMKHFIVAWGNYWKFALRDYNWCFWVQKAGSCNRSVAVLKFTDSAINQLEEDYKDVRNFWACNDYANYFRSTINKTINNNAKSVETAIEDVNAAIKRLKEALVGKWWRWNLLNDPCKNISDYEMTQLKAYWGSNWKCGEWTSVHSLLSKAREYFKNKKMQRDQKEKTENILKMSDKPESKEVMVWDAADRLQAKQTTEEKTQEYLKLYWDSKRYNADFLYELNASFISVYQTTIVEFVQDQEDGIAADISDILPRWKWDLDQVAADIKATKILNNDLQDVADYQAVN